jgi:hypothetical protein
VIVATNWDVFVAGAMLGVGWVVGSAVANLAVGYVRGASRAVRERWQAAKAGKVAA